MSFKEKFFEEAYNLAEKGRGLTSPNPFVGAVLVRDNVIIGRGYTQPWGKDHAEIQAIKDANYDCEGAEMYVTLEPCPHYGKTPPCADAIIKHKIKSVYAGIKDPNPKVNGKGFEKLKNAGVFVKTGIWKSKIEKQLEYYLKFIISKRPFVFSKIATSMDGKISSSTGKSKWITNEKSRKYVHKLRAEADVIITGINTVLADNPTFNVRFGEAKNNPIRIILDSRLRLPVNSNIAETAKDIQTIVFVYSLQKDAKYLSLKKLGIEIKECPLRNGGLDLQYILDYVYSLNKYLVMIEAGNKINSSFLAEKLIDKLYHFVAPKIIGGKNSLFQNYIIDEIKESVNLTNIDISNYDEDLLFQYYLRYSG